MRDRELEGELQNLLDNGGRLWVIGDIHGYYDSFLRLVSKLNLDDGDLVISIGDMIDGGPESVGVVDFFIGKRSVPRNPRQPRTNAS